MLNRIILTGRITATPTLKTTSNGSSVVNFSIANQRNYKGASGEKETDFFEVVAWRNTADFVTKYFSKGDLITVDGRLETRKFVDKNGVNRVAFEIIAEDVFFGSSKGDGAKKVAEAPKPEEAADDGVVDEDDLPF